MTAAAAEFGVAEPAIGISPRLVGPPDLPGHLAVHGALPRLRPGEVIDLAAGSGLTGRGGAGFPTARKLAAVAAGRGSVVLANGAEGEPASHKDKWLLANVPHLVLDGVQLAAVAVGAHRAFLYIHRNAWLQRTVGDAIAERRRGGLDRIEVRLVVAPPRFLAGEESAAVNRVSGGAAVPRFKVPPIYQRGVGGAPTLVQNVETLAHLARIAREGAEWFRRAGTAEQPGTLLTTCQRSDGRVDVVECEYGAAIPELLDLPRMPAQAVLIGGYHGCWVAGAAASGLVLSDRELARVGARVGAGVLVALPHGRCGLVESARAIGYLARESAGQCGPCVNGLPSIARAFAALAAGTASGKDVADLGRWAGLVEHRGACHHPDGSVRLVRSALVTFAGEVDSHLAGRCTASDYRPFLPVPSEQPPAPGDWL